MDEEEEEQWGNNSIKKRRTVIILRLGSSFGSLQSLVRNEAFKFPANRPGEIEAMNLSRLQ